jgi:cell division septum initiation protein DivIVA
MEILRLLDELEEMADRGERWYCRIPPFIGKTVLDAADLFDLISQMRANRPKEMTEATQVTRDRDRIVEEAHEQRAKILEAAREQAQLMVSNDELVKQAETKAEAIIGEAGIEAESIKADAETWARGVVERLENYTNRMQATVQKTKKMLSAQAIREPEEPGLPPEE